MKKLILMLIISFTAGYIVAQEVITTAGDEFIQPGFSIILTIGEPVSETSLVGDVILTQGFQQPWDFGYIQWIQVKSGWSGISGFIEPYNNDLGYLFEGHQESLIVLSNFAGMYFPSQGINTLNAWDPVSGYQVKANEEFNLRLRGSTYTNTSFEYDFGWHLLPVISACNVDLSDLLAGIEDFVIMKQVAGTGVYWPQYGINTIGDLLPGKAYYLHADDLINISFPDCNNRKTVNIKTNDDIVNLTPWGDPVPTAISHLVLFPENTIPGSDIQAGDFIGAFNTLGNCNGLMQISGMTKNLCMTVFGDDPITPDSDGFIQGEPLTFRSYRVNGNKETGMEVIFDPAFPSQGFFANHGVSALKKVEFLNTNTDGDSEQPDFNIFPNPAREQITITLNRKLPTQISILLFDTFGQKVKELKLDPQQIVNQQFTLDVSHLKPGAYLITLKTNDKKSVRKLTIIH